MLSNEVLFWLVRKGGCGLVERLGLQVSDPVSLGKAFRPCAPPLYRGYSTAHPSASRSPALYRGYISPLTARPHCIPASMHEPRALI
jgi:hypothetical protein